MIVTIAAWLYLAQAALILISFALGPLRFSQGLLVLVFAGLFGALGYGLLKRLPWARWLALGSSLLGWTLGSLFLLLTVGYLVTVAPLGAVFALVLGPGIFSIFGIVLLFTLLIWVANIVISFKLFWHLWSESGAQEFGAEHGSLQELAASTGTWLGLGVLNFMLSSGGNLSFPMSRGSEGTMTASDSGGDSASETARAQADYDERRARSEAMLRAQAEIEAAQADGEEYDESDTEEEEYEEEAPVEFEDTQAANQAGSASSSESESESEEEDEPKAKSILKCIDASGGTIYTQGYCPPGSRQARTAQ